MTHTGPLVVRKFAQKSVLAPVRPRASLSEVFHENSKLTRLSGRIQGARIASIARSRDVVQMLLKAYKVYSLGAHLALPDAPPRNQLEEVICARRSQRKFSGDPIGREALARLLFYGYGRTDGKGFFRAVPSGGGLYPLDLYVVALRVDELPAGIYHYDVEHHRLDIVQPHDAWAGFKERVVGQGIEVDRAACAVVLTATFVRSTFKYQDRGYRMVLIEAGEVAQNIALAATALGLGTCALGGFFDDRLSELLGIDGVEEAPLLPILVGCPAPEEER